MDMHWVAGITVAKYPGSKRLAALAYAEDVDYLPDILLWWPYMEALEHISENDRIWGAGNWVVCSRETCFNGKPQFHHAEFH